MKQSVQLPTNGNPRPRDLPDTLSAPLDWPITRVIDCRRVVPPLEQPFTSTLELRRSRRAMVRAPLRVVVNAIAFAARPRQKMVRDRFNRSRRPSPSAGAIHPVEILLVHGSSWVFRYAAFKHQIEVLRISDRTSLRSFVSDCHQILPEALGTAIVFVGDLDRVAALYERSESLLWRDAGVLLQTLALVATAYGLAFCPLGILGDLVVRSLGLPERALAVGVAMIGRLGFDQVEYLASKQVWSILSD